MPRVLGMKQRRHQPFYDTLLRTFGASGGVQASTRLFGNANVGNVGLTNLQTPGQLASDQTYQILALRVWLHFEGTNMRFLYRGVLNQLYWTLFVGDKPQFQMPTWYFPSGGGTWGAGTTTANTTMLITNGVPSQEAILKLAKPIAVPVRQHFSALAEFFVVGSVDVRNGATSLNTGATDDEKTISFILDGVQTRDVE